MAIIILGVLALVALIIILIYNGLIRRKNEVDNAFGGVDVQLKKRYDLIPNLIAAVKQYMIHEKSTLEALTELRTKTSGEQLSPEQKIDVDNQITQKLGSLMVQVENYPDLKASGNFMHLQRSLNEVESQISAARRTYNAVVTDYNNGLEMFPSNIIASMLAYKRKEVFIIPDIERQNVSVADHF